MPSFAPAARFDALTLMPPGITDRAPLEGDERFVTVTGRRPVLEFAVAATAGQCVDIRRGERVPGLLTGAPAATGIPNVTGVRLAGGEELAAGLVIDAMGRRSRLPGWLAAIGARPPMEQACDSGFIYYTRYFRATAGAVPPFRAGLLTPFDCFSLVTLPDDAQTWSVTVYISSRDQPLKRLRDPGRWTALVAACPLHAPPARRRADHRRAGDERAGQPVPTPGRARRPGGHRDRQRRRLQACTNPSLGRGITTGLLHAAGTLDVVRQHLDDPLALARGHDQMTQTRVRPWYQDTIDFDRDRKEQIDASIAGRPAPGGPGGTGPPGPAGGHDG